MEDRMGRGGKKKVRKGTWGGKAKTKDHLRGHMKAYYNRNFLKYTQKLKNYK